MDHQGQTGHATARVDEHGNPVAGHGTTATGVHGGTPGDQKQPMKDDRKTGGVLRRSGSSSSSSSSEDDGMGGRRKKGIKEKLPGGNKDSKQHATATGGTTGTTGAHGTAADGTGEKKGVMEKIKEKLPGTH